MKQMEEMKSEDSEKGGQKSNRSVLTILTEEMVMPEQDSEEEKLEDQSVEEAIKSNEQVLAQNRQGITR